MATAAAHRARTIRNFGLFQGRYNSYKANGPDAEPVTKVSLQLSSCINLYHTSARLVDAVTVIHQVASILQDKDVSHNQRKLMARNLKQIISPLLTSASKDVISAAKAVTPMAGIPDQHMKLEVKRKNTAMAELKKSSKTNMSVELKMIENFIKLGRLADTDEDNVTPRKMNKRKATQVSPDKDDEYDDIDLPLPKDTVSGQYSKPEAIDILAANTKKKTPERGRWMRKMISKGYTPTNERTLQRYLAMKEEGKVVIDDAWSGPGRKRIMTEKDINDKVAQWRLGEAHAANCVQDAMIESQANLVKRSGAVPITLKNNKFAKSTVQSYKCQFALHHDVSIVEKAKPKTKTRFIQERSWRNAVGNLGLFGSCLFVPVEEEDLFIRNQLKKLDEETRMLYDMVTDIRGCPQHPVKPHLIYSTDDTKPYVYAGVAPPKDTVLLTTNESVKQRGNQAVFMLDDGKSMTGMRIDLTFTFSGAGTCFPIVATVSGLTKEELPDTEFLDIVVPGFGIGGGVTVNNSVEGHVLLMRDTPGAKQKRCEWYQKTILVPGINDHRLEYDGFDTSVNNEIPVEETAVSMCDGDIPQLNAIKKHVDMYVDNRITALKHPSASSAINQPADKCPIFKALRQALPMHTVRDIPPEACPIKRKVYDAFQCDRLAGLKLSTTKKESLIDFIAILPPILSKICSVESIQKGFVNTGILDERSRRFPSFNGILACCKRDPSEEEYLHVVDTYASNLQTHDAKGFADEEWHNEHDMVKDRDEHGEIYEKTAGNTQEHCQRGKNITHPYVCEERDALTRQHRTSKLEQMLMKNKKHQDLIDANQEVVNTLLKKAQASAAEFCRPTIEW